PCSGQPLLQSVMKNGKLTVPGPGLIGIREYTHDQLQRLPAPLRKLSDTPDYPVVISSELQALANKVDEQTP
ncbi:MAG: nicotinate phosphoribosyltransferase, partial [Methylococcaceae bacterium]